MPFTETQERAFDFFCAFGKAHGAKDIYRDGQSLTQSDEEFLTDAMIDYPSHDSHRAPGLFPMRMVFDLKAGEEHSIIDALRDLQANTPKIPGYTPTTEAVNPDGQSWRLADGISARRIKSGPGLRQSQIAVEIEAPSEP